MTHEGDTRVLAYDCQEDTGVVRLDLKSKRVYPQVLVAGNHGFEWVDSGKSKPIDEGRTVDQPHL